MSYKLATIREAFAPRTTISDIVFAMALSALLAGVIFSKDPALRLTYDSYDYLSASETADTYLHDKNKDGFPYFIRQPLLPAYLHLFEDKLFGAALLNVVSYAVSIFLCLTLARALGLVGPYVYLFVVATSFSYTWLQCHLFLWTEPLFSTLTLCLFYAVFRNKHISLVISLLLLSFLLRKAGGFLCVACVLVFLKRNEFRKSLIVAVTMGMFFIFWELMSYQLSGFSASAITFSDHVLLSRTVYLDSLTSWIVPRAIPLWVRIILCLGMLAILWRLNRRPRHPATARPSTLRKLISGRTQQTLLLFSSTYLFCLIAFWGAPDFGEAERFLSVVLPLVMLSVFSLLQHALPGSGESRFPGSLLVALWSAYPLGRTLFHLFYAP